MSKINRDHSQFFKVISAEKARVCCPWLTFQCIGKIRSAQELIIAPDSAGARFFGVKAASPNRIGGDRYEDYTWGTSVATALATRAGHGIHDLLLDGANGSNHSDIPA